MKIADNLNSWPITEYLCYADPTISLSFWADLLILHLANKLDEFLAWVYYILERFIPSVYVFTFFSAIVFLIGEAILKTPFDHPIYYFYFLFYFLFYSFFYFFTRPIL